ncbi:MAG: signal recognition particle-docking protein FtsY [Verrucomicrobia bacterium]|nr:signal recognition particle-docking protein FtsY [Verrucomicrobiota bacterium]
MVFKGIFNRLKSGLKKTHDRITAPLMRFVTGKRVDQDALDELEATFLQADMGVETTERLLEVIRTTYKEEGRIDHDRLIERLETELVGELAEDAEPLIIAPQPPTVILVVGVNGTGKTTTIAKLGKMLMDDGKSVFFAACDTFRAAAIEQLAIWAERVGAGLIKHQHGADPAAVAFDAVEAARARGIDYLIIDTAGRLHTKVNLMEEIKKIQRTIRKKLPDAPHETLLVLDATTGQNALQQARLFNDALGLTGLVLTKLDGTAKGGIVISIQREFHVPVKFIGVGEGFDDLQPFVPAQFARALLE